MTEDDMTMRDHFAAQIMATLVAPQSLRLMEKSSAIEVAILAYEFADAMLEARRHQGSHGLTKTGLANTTVGYAAGGTPWYPEYRG